MTSTSDPTPPPVLQLRVVVEAEDYDAAPGVYRDVLGLPEQAAFEGEGDARVTILEAGRATLEIANPAQKRMIDQVEVGRPVSPGSAGVRGHRRRRHARGSLTRRELIAPPTETPWRSLNSRLETPAGLQITLFQELEALDKRGARDGFGTAGERDG